MLIWCSASAGKSYPRLSASCASVNNPLSDSSDDEYFERSDVRRCVLMCPELKTSPTEI